MDSELSKFLIELNDFLSTNAMSWVKFQRQLGGSGRIFSPQGLYRRTKLSKWLRDETTSTEAREVRLWLGCNSTTVSGKYTASIFRVELWRGCGQVIQEWCIPSHPSVYLRDHCPCTLPNLIAFSAHSSRCWRSGQPCTSETLAHMYKSARCHNPKDHNPGTHGIEHRETYTRLWPCV
jgi:hypothetical protein